MFTVEEVTLTVGGVQTATMTALLSAVRPHVLVARAQYDVVPAGDTVMPADAPLVTGLVVVPLLPVYHWYVTPAVFAATVRFADWPLVMLAPVGCCVICGTQTVTLVVPPLVVQALSRNWYQYCVVLVGATVSVVAADHDPSGCARSPLAP